MPPTRIAWGYRPTPADHIRPPFKHLATRLKLGVYLPDACDLLACTCMVLSQRDIGSCGGHAHAGAIYTTMGAQGTPLGWIPSPDDLYRNTRCLERDRETPHDEDLPPLTDSGAIPAYCQLAINQWGVRPMRPGPTADGYTNSDCDWATVNREPDLLDLETASENLLVGQYEITGSASQRGLSVRQAIVGNIAVEIGSFVDTAYMRWTPDKGPYGVPDYADFNGGGHDQFIVGFKKVGSDFWYLIQNSWDTDWCMDGRIWVKESFLGQASDLNAIAVRRAS